VFTFFIKITSCCCSEKGYSANYFRPDRKTASAAQAFLTAMRVKTYLMQPIKKAVITQRINDKSVDLLKQRNIH